ncbi:glycoside hydrolase family 3 C-terminal domain-containing protein [uncultured Mucilaginibacter sp.]|nr:glycoside hydrolase family 3 C-terminal domain-containing protein [uncultured Mucilaginibacter sp.]
MLRSANAQTSSEKAIDKKIDHIVKQLTLKEKIAMLHGNALFSSDGVKRLGIPELTCDDGPLGVREEVGRYSWTPLKLKTDSATYFPNGSAMAATWNPALAYQYGVTMAQEALARHKNILLAPAFNICRTPLCGRTYEYYSEDPFLNAQLAISAVKGIQSQHVAACVKHFAVNNQETMRDSINVVIGERALREIYLPAFKAAIQQGHAYSLMSAYNVVNGAHCSENDFLLNKILKGEWGFKGLVMSDWGGTHSTVNAANNGLDLEMGSKGPYSNWYFADPLYNAVKAGQVSERVIDEKVHRILWVIFHTSMAEHQLPGSINTPGHSKAVYDMAAESIVLLKNQNHTLPLNTANIKSIAVIGDNAIHTFATGGYGAGVKAKYEITALQGIKSRLGKDINIRFAQGYKANYKTNYTAQQKENANNPNPVLISEAVDLAKNSDLAILCIGSNRDYESENSDRKNLNLPFGEQELVNAVTAANPNTIVVIMAGAPYDIADIKNNNNTVLWSWFNGSEAGNALADVLFGKINPSGKLPFTFPAHLDDSPAHALHTFPGENLTADYKEGILVGYRWFDTKNIEPLYCFGYGLSYTSFKYSAFKTNKKRYKTGEHISATLLVNNTGKYAGKETVQLYVGKLNSKTGQPEKQLKAFKKVSMIPEQGVQVVLRFKTTDLAYFSEDLHKWTIEPGEYKISVGSSSRDIRQSTIITVAN